MQAKNGEVDLDGRSEQGLAEAEEKPEGVGCGCGDAEGEEEPEDPVGVRRPGSEVRYAGRSANEAKCDLVRSMDVRAVGFMLNFQSG